MCSNVGVGKVYIDKYDAGRIYIPKELMSKVKFCNKEQVVVIVEKR
jgi:DNA-binding transcriptional regulator/RsmH inhibitor MraZ